MGSKAPKPPDPYKVSDAQTQSNIKTAQEQAKLGMSGQSTPYGSLSYEADPNSPSGYKAISTLSPEQQQLLQQQQGVANSALGSVANTVGQPFDLNAGRATELTDIQHTLLDPQWAQKEQQLQTNLVNRGIRMGSDQYDTALRQFNQQKDDAYNKMYLDAYNTANNAALTQRNLPLSDLAAIGGAGVQPAGFVNTPSPGVAPTDVSGNVNSNYQIQAGQSNAQMGGLYGLGSSLLGGWAMSPAGGTAISTALSALPIISDRRLKMDVRRIGTDPRGWGVYMFKYILDAVRSWQIGFMAQEVEQIRPDAVVTDEKTGAKMVDYDALALA